ncbi:MAG: hypothetical protein JJT75_09195 [Opitutales bacterium]|nr:hypothetical protein [Opitutales bacterium]
MTENEGGKIVVDTAIHLHRALGPGPLESVYEVTLVHLSPMARGTIVALRFRKW